MYRAAMSSVPADLPTRDRLIATAAALFRQKGYHATGLTEILDQAGVPKGSLYHHFPEGKADLARAAADWTADIVLRIIDDAFGPAVSYPDGATTFCHKLARLYDLTASADTCPISALLFDGPESPAFRAHAEAVFARLIGAIAAHAQRLGMEEPAATTAAETLLITVEGGWTLARARQSSAILRSLPGRLFP